MLQSALIQNVQTRPDVFGARQFAPLPSQKVPLYTLPPIVGDTMYTPGQGESIGTQFFRDKMSPVRTFGDPLNGRPPTIGRMDMDKYQNRPAVMPRGGQSTFEQAFAEKYGGQINMKRPSVMPNKAMPNMMPLNRRQQLGLGEPNQNSSQR
jgi:hypothetical protein